MITKFMTFIVFVLFSYLASACEVHLPDHLVILGEVANVMKESTSTECTDQALSEINQTLLSVEGKISSFRLKEILKAKNQDVNIQPGLIQVQHLSHMVREQILLPSGVQLRSAEAINAPNYLVLSEGERVEVQCQGCLFSSQQPLNVMVTGYDGNTRSITVRGNFKKMVKAFKVTESKAAFSDVSKASLKEVFVESIPHTDLVTDLETLHFYKLNKPLRAGELLRQSDLNALNLVRAGNKTEVIIENALVKLKTNGISRSNGSIGQFVEVYHPQKNKKYLGKVIDLNKVLIDL